MTSEIAGRVSSWTCPKCGPGFVVTAEQAATHERLCDGPEQGRGPSQHDHRCNARAPSYTTQPDGITVHCPCGWALPHRRSKRAAKKDWQQHRWWATHQTPPPWRHRA